MEILFGLAFILIVVIGLFFLPKYIRTKRLRVLAEKYNLSFQKREGSLFARQYKKNILQGQVGSHVVVVYDTYSEKRVAAIKNTFISRITVIEIDGIKKNTFRVLGQLVSVNDIEECISNLQNDLYSRKL